MANMSYCRFENTANDLEDCLEAMSSDNFSIEELSSFEKKGYNELVNLCIAIACDFGNCTEE